MSRTSSSRWFPFGPVLILMLLTTASWVHPKDVFAGHYNCDGTEDCYGTVAWNGGMDGADTRIYTGTMTMNSSEPDFHINNALWVTDKSVSDDCDWMGIPTGTAWVEVGYQAENYSHFYYWVDCRISANYYEEFLGPVTSGNKYKYNFFQIIRTYPGSPYWRVTIDNTTGTDYIRESWTNPMSADNIRIGGEASGNHGGYAANAYYSDNRWIWVLSSGTNFTYQNAWQDDGVPGSGVDYRQTNKWQSSWSLTPTTANHGGKWRTYFPS